MKIFFIQDKKSGRMFVVPVNGVFIDLFEDALEGMKKFLPTGDFSLCGETPAFDEKNPEGPVALVSVDGQTELPFCRVLLEDVTMCYPEFRPS
jgi:hypothetical protein